MAAIWKGSIAFGLVQIPVELVSAEHANDLSFHLLDKRDFSPVGYERVSKTSGKKVAWSDIVRGYEHEKGEFVVLSDEELKAANAEATQTIELVTFVDPDEIDPMFFDRPYYLVPGTSGSKSKAGLKAYALLRETLKRSKKIGIGTVVLRTKQHLAAVVPRDRALSLVLLRYADEVRSEEDLDLPPATAKQTGLTPRELSLASNIVEGMVGEWEPTQYRDDFRQDLLALIARKVKAGKINTVSAETPRHAKPTGGGKVIDLMALLERSVGRGKSGQSTAAKKVTAHTSHRAPVRPPPSRASSSKPAARKVSPRKSA